METIEKCPENLWEDKSYENAYWRIVYHSLFYTAFYLSGSPDKFTPWSGHVINYNYLGSVTQDNEPVIINKPYSKVDLTNYSLSIFNNLGSDISELSTEDHGFEWLPMSRLELHLYTIRHLQHHVGQLVERLHQNGIKGLNWIR